MAPRARAHRLSIPDEFEFDDDVADDDDALDATDDDVADGLPVRAARPSSARQRGRAARASKSARQTRVALSDDDVDPSEEWGPPQRDRDRDRKRVAVSEPFKCRHCRAFVGIPPTGGRNRNHCPLCLYSLHVDGKTPGDRSSDCQSSMAPIGVFYRLNLEQVVVHRCLGCGFVRYNRVAADDNPVVLAGLPVLSPTELAEAVSGEL